MEKIKQWFKTHKDYFIPSLCVFVIMFIAFILKGVYPFGNGYTGMMDYAAGLVPSYTYLWDFIHGKESFLFNGDLGLGANIYASSILNTFLSPLSYLIGLSSREGIQYFIGFIVVIKLMLMATTAYIVFKKWFKDVDYKWLCLFSVVWALSGWLLVHISNVGWLEVMIIFPFLLDGIKDIVDKAKMSKFVICLTLSLIFSYYMSYMILIMIITLTISMLYTIVEKEKKKQIVGQLFLGILFSLFISMFAFLPSFLQSQSAYRFQADFSVDVATPLYSKLSILCFYSILLYLPLCLFIKHKDDKNSKFFMVFLILTTMTVIVEPINKMWHTGSYFCYPYRFSYIPIFFMILTSLYYLGKYYNKDQKEPVNKNKYEPFAIILALTVATLYIAAIVADIYLDYHLSHNIGLSHAIFYVLPGLSALALIIVLSKYLKIEKRKWMLGIITISQVLLCTIGYMGYKTNTVNNIYNIKDKFDTDSLDKNYAIKDETGVLTPNFPLLLEQKSISTWLHINSQYENINAIALGYRNSSTMIYSYGGTYFSDMLVNNKYVLSLNKLGESAYTLVETKNVELSGEETTVYLYEYKYLLPLSLIVNKDIEFKEFEVGTNPYDNQNYLYKTLFNKNEDIINVTLTDKKVTTREYNIALDNEFLYLNSNGEEVKSYKVYINGELYVSSEDNGIVNLGVYDEVVKVKIESEEALDEIQFATLKVDSIKNLVNETVNDSKVEYEGNKITIKVTADKASKLYVPVNYEDGSWSALVNNKEATVIRFAQTYLAIDLKEGENVVELTFTPKMMKIGILLTIVTLILVLGFALINKKYEFFKKKKFTYVMYVLGTTLGLLIGAYVYIIPLLK